MPVYDYTAYDAKGKTISGIIDADGAAAARQKIRTSGYYPVELREVVDGVAQAGDRGRRPFAQRFTRIRPVEVSIMTRQLATLIGAGFPLVSALDSLISQTNKPALKKVVAGIKESVVEGTPFAKALGKYPNIFSSIYVNMVDAGESSGTLEIVLERLADIMEKQEALKNRMITAMIYPILILMISAVIISFMLIYVTPKIMSMFESLKQELPLPTQILIAISEFFQSYWWALVLLVIAALLGLRAIGKSKEGRRWMDTHVLGMPLFGSLIRRMAAARFSRTLGSLLENGISMLPALGIVQNIVGNVFISQSIANASEEVGKGQGLGKSLDKDGAFPPMAIQMIQVGEQSGNLEEMLNKVADVFEKEVETTAMRLTALVEPVMILVMACLVTFIVLAICLPIFEMNQLIR
ncbi:type II secretion system inner membrane protein GspF [Desulfatitalea tepidiphila]|uniref:type II secretion system inner membrane protein GspF n=1 Tax=Desulfatitalea tepidiphila TaxID=1185843 RepID=UPI0006B4F62D|nr:type II secretion system inner membrane protein GspF [Desulfatitalea tepidiphila]